MKGNMFLPGRVWARVSGAGPEGFLNIGRGMGLEIYAARAESELSLLLSFSGRQTDIARRAALRSGCSLELLGPSFSLRWLRLLRRRAFPAAGAVLLLGLLLWSRFFVWEIDTENCPQDRRWEILHALEQAGLKSGSFWPELSSEELRNRVLLELPELAWIGVSMEGSLARVQAVERCLPPEMGYRGAPADIVAERGGFVHSVSALAGSAAVSRGSAVLPGDILISGAVESGFAPPRFLRAQGCVMAETFRSVTALCPQTLQEKSYTGREKSRFALLIGDKRINFYSDSSISGANCDTIISVWKAEIKGLFSLPLAIVRERDRYYELLPRQLTEAQAAALLDPALDRALESIGPQGVILEQDRRIFSSGGLIYAEVRARCMEDIGRLQEISPGRMEEINHIYQQKKADETNGGTQN